MPAVVGIIFPLDWTALKHAMTKVLVYGFGLYDRHERNISGDLVRQMRLPRNVHREVFDVRFERAIFTGAIDRHDPEIIIGLGQSAHSRKIRIERKALNLMGERGEEKRPIRKGGQDQLFMTLDIPHDDRVRVSYDAGTYVCNYSMYVIADYCHGSDRRVGFMHLPKHAGDEAADFVGEVIASLG